jgi:Uma2 family endonuclease
MQPMKLDRRATIEDLMLMPEDGQKYELVDGEIVVSPTGYRHSAVGMRIGYLIQRYLDEHPIGEVAGSDLGVVFENGDLRSPDLTFVRKEKVPTGEAHERFLEVVPDLVVEVLSPSDSMRFVGHKIGEFLECGVPIVWLVDPAQQAVTVYRSLTNTERYTVNDTITAEPILPGFSCAVSRFFGSGPEPERGNQ